MTMSRVSLAFDVFKILGSLALFVTVMMTGAIGTAGARIICPPGGLSCGSSCLPSSLAGCACQTSCASKTIAGCTSGWFKCVGTGGLTLACDSCNPTSGGPYTCPGSCSTLSQGTCGGGFKECTSSSSSGPPPASSLSSNAAICSILTVYNDVSTIIFVLGLMLMILGGALYAAGTLLSGNTRGVVQGYGMGMIVGGVVAVVIAELAPFILQGFTGFSAGALTSSFSTYFLC